MISIDYSLLKLKKQWTYPPFLKGKTTLSMAIFNSKLLPEGMCIITSGFLALRLSQLENQRCSKW
jgi:hypothetical protein